MFYIDYIDERIDMDAPAVGRPYISEAVTNGIVKGISAPYYLALLRARESQQERRER